MQTPTCKGLRIGTPAEAHIVFHAVRRGFRPMITRRLDTDERRSIQSGDVFVWEERCPNAESSIGIERWTDSIRWGPSRVRDEFLYYNEKDTPNDGDSPPPISTLPGNTQLRESYRGNLVKQTYSVFVDTDRGRRKWHLIAYFTQDTLTSLRTVKDFPDLMSIQVPPGMYKSARCGNRGAARPSVQEPFPMQPGSYSPPTLYPPQTSLDYLAPLEYLKACPPPHRHPLDERALMSFVHSSTVRLLPTNPKVARLKP